MLSKVKKLDLADFPETTIASKINEVNRKLEEFDAMIEAVINSNSLDQAKVDAIISRIQDFDNVLIEDPDIRAYMLEQFQGEGQGFEDVKQISSAIQTQIDGRIAFLLNQRSINKSSNFDDLKTKLEEAKTTSTQKTVEQVEEISSNPDMEYDFSKEDARVSKGIKTSKKKETLLKKYEKVFKGVDFSRYSLKDEYAHIKDAFDADKYESFTARADRLSRVELGLDSFKDLVQTYISDVDSGELENVEDKNRELLEYIDLAVAQEGIDGSFKTKLRQVQRALRIKNPKSENVKRKLEGLGLDSRDLKAELRIEDNKEKLITDFKGFLEKSKFLQLFTNDRGEAFTQVVLNYMNSPTFPSSGYHSMIDRLTQEVNGRIMPNTANIAMEIDTYVRQQLKGMGKTVVDDEVLRIVSARLKMDREHFEGIKETIDDVKEYDENAETQRSDTAPRLDLSMLGIDSSEGFQFAKHEQLVENGHPVFDDSGAPVYTTEQIDPRDHKFEDDNSGNMAQNIFENIITEEQRKELMEESAENPPMGFPKMKRGRFEGIREFFAHHRLAIFGGPTLTRREQQLQVYSLIKIKDQISKQSSEIYKQEEKDKENRQVNARREQVRERFDEVHKAEVVRETIEAKGKAQTDEQKQEVNRRAVETATKAAIEARDDDDGR